MKTYIFVHRANLEANKKNGNDKLPMWFVMKGESLLAVRSWKTTGEVVPQHSIDRPLPVEGKVHVWLETEGDVEVIE